MRNGIKCCKDCADKQIGCHAYCERYIAEKQALQEWNDKIRAEKKKRLQINKYEVDRSYKFKRGKGIK